MYFVQFFWPLDGIICFQTNTPENVKPHGCFYQFFQKFRICLNSMLILFKVPTCSLTEQQHERMHERGVWGFTEASLAQVLTTPQQGCLTTPCFYLSPTLQGCSHDPSFARPIRSYCHRISASTDSYRGGSVMGTLLRLLGKMSFPFRRTIRRKAVLCLHLLRSMRKMPEGNAVPREQSEGVTRGWIRWCF